MSCLIVGAGCKTTSSSEPYDDFEALQDASDAYLAFARGDCRTVLQMTQEATLEFWQASELRDSMWLVRGFCQEQNGQPIRAGKTYQHHSRFSYSVDSFAALDAKERLRVLRLQKDPEYASALAEGRRQADRVQVDRAPLERSAAVFPPVPREAGVEGFAVVAFSVASDGRTLDPMIVESVPSLVFDGAAVRAVRSWLYSRSGGSRADPQLVRFSFKNAEPSLTPETPETPETTEETANADLGDAPVGSGSMPPE